MPRHDIVPAGLRGGVWVERITAEYRLNGVGVELMILPVVSDGDDDVAHFDERVDCVKVFVAPACVVCAGLVIELV